MSIINWRFVTVPPSIYPQCMVYHWQNLTQNCVKSNIMIIEHCLTMSQNPKRWATIKTYLYINWECMIKKFITVRFVISNHHMLVVLDPTMQFTMGRIILVIFVSQNFHYHKVWKHIWILFTTEFPSSVNKRIHVILQHLKKRISKNMFAGNMNVNLQAALLNHQYKEIFSHI